MLRLAESLGAETATLTGGQQFSDDVLSYAHARNVTKIVMGKPHRSRLQRWLFGSIVDAIVAGSGAIDVNIVSTDLAGGAGRAPADGARPGWAWAVVRANSPAASRAVTATSWASLWCCLHALAWGMSGRFELSNIVMVYLLGVVVVAVRYGRGPSVLASVLGVAAFDFFFVPPYFTFAVSDTQYVVTFGVMLVVGLVISKLGRQHAPAGAGGSPPRAAHRRALCHEPRTRRHPRPGEPACDRSTPRVRSVRGAIAVLLLPDAGTGMLPARSSRGSRGAACRPRGGPVGLDHGQAAGRGTDTLPGSEALYLPLQSSDEMLGVLAVAPAELRQVMLPEQRRLLEPSRARSAGPGAGASRRAWHGRRSCAWRPSASQLALERHLS